MSCDFRALATPGVQKLTPYQTGKPEDELQRELGLSRVVKLASNENPLGPGRAALHAARKALESMHRYPDGAGFYLKQALHETLGVAPTCITLGNGSNDVLELIARAFTLPGDEIVFSEHAFAVYPLATLACSAVPVAVPARLFGHDLEAMAAAVTERTRVIFVANPNNPTGTWFHRHALESFLEQVPERVVVVLDEAYFEYVQETDYPNGLDYLSRFPNLVVTRTFSKIHGLAGLRIGYGISSEAIADVLNRVRQPFNANAPALAAAQAALADESYVRDSRDLNTAGLAQLAEGLQARDLHFIPSVANFLCFDCGAPAEPLYRQLLAKGIIVRPVAGYGLPNHLRVSVGLAEENAAFLAALDEVCADG
ncbi:MAG: histidinol-phosphate transaminase [Alcanivoracaceae bacterium]|nr:histidinol-phosphate transaminase [Alcanivoracaceae bacterium]